MSRQLKAVTVRMSDRLHALAGAGAREAGLSVSGFVSQLVERQLLGSAQSADEQPAAAEYARDARNIASALGQVLADLVAHVEAGMPLNGTQREQAKRYRSDVIERMNHVLERLEADHDD